MPDFHTVSGPVALSISSNLSSLDWREGTMDGQPLLEADAGQLALTVYTDAEPPRWSVTLICMDQAVGGGFFTVEGEALSIASAQIDAASAAPVLIDRAVRYLAGEEDLR